MSTRIEQTRAEGAAANHTRRSQTNLERDPQGGSTVKATTISFTNPATIADSGNGFGAIIVGDRIRIRGSAANSRDWLVTAAAAGSLTVAGGTVTTEAAGPLITVERI